MRDEADLIRAAARGDRRSFDELVVRKRERVVRTAYQVTGNLEDARDVAQTVFLALWRSLRTYDPKRQFDTWLHRVTMNAAIDLLRGRGPRAGERPLVEFSDSALPVEAPVVEEDLGRREIRSAFLDLARDLPPQQRAAFVLREIEGRSSREIGDILGIGESTVRNHLLLARRALRRGLEQRYPDLVRRFLGEDGS